MLTPPWRRRGGSCRRQPAERRGVVREYGRWRRVGQLEPDQEAFLLGLQQTLAPGLQILAGRFGEPAHGVLAEDGFEDPLANDGGAAGYADLQSRQARRHGKDDDHQRRTQAVDAERQPAGLAAFALALGPDEFHQAPLPPPDLGS